MDVKKKLLENCEKDYQKFSASLLPNIDNVLGVRLPILRKISKEIYKKHDWQEFLKVQNCEFMEEKMLQGMVIGLIKDEPQKILKFVEKFVPKIDNWSVCDSFCNDLKFAKNNLQLVWEFIQPYWKSKKEYEIRFAYVMMLKFFVNDEYIDTILKCADEFKDTRYYAQMSVAWLICECYIKYPQKTFAYLKNSKLDKWTFNKSIQKICESLRVTKEEKNRLRMMKVHDIIRL